MLFQQLNSRQLSVAVFAKCTKRIAHKRKNGKEKNLFWLPLAILYVIRSLVQHSRPHKKLYTSYHHSTLLTLTCPLPAEMLTVSWSHSPHILHYAEKLFQLRYHNHTYWEQRYQHIYNRVHNMVLRQQPIHGLPKIHKREKKTYRWRDKKKTFSSCYSKI